MNSRQEIQSPFLIVELRILFMMSTFTTRVQLNGDPSEAEYESLHKEMHRRGFSRFIQSTDGKWYRLPHAEYNRNAEATCEQVRTDASAAAKAAAPTRGHKVLVSVASQRCWIGLEEVTAEVARGA